MDGERPAFVEFFWNSDPRGNWINWLTIDADGWLSGHSEEPLFKNGYWGTSGPEGITIRIKKDVAYNHPKNLIWSKEEIVNGD